MDERAGGHSLRCAVILLAGGSGKRMGTRCPKQYLVVAGKPLIWYALQALERSRVVDDCVLVTPQKDMEFVKEKIVLAGGFTKVRTVAAGGRERCESVWKGICALEESAAEEDRAEIIMIHDGVRPFLTEELLERCFRGAVEYGACTAAIPARDTVTISDEEGFERETPDRRRVWNVQTPQAFRREVLLPAFESLAQELAGPLGEEVFSGITDDVSVVRRYTGARIRLIQGDYRNIKVTTEEDLGIAECFLGEASGEAGNRFR